MKIYLAHPLDSRKQMRTWQEETEIEGIEFINPFYDVNRLDIATIDKEGITRVDVDSGRFQVSPIQIVEGDIDAIHSCDILLAFISGEKSIGTFMEMVKAFEVGIPVHTVAHESMFHPWVQYHSELIFSTLASYADHLERVYGKDTEADTGKQAG